MLKNIITPHKLHKKENINHNNVTSYENMLVTTPHKQTYMSRKNIDISDNSIKKQIIERQGRILSPSVQMSSSTCINNMIIQHKLHEKEIINHNNVSDRLSTIYSAGDDTGSSSYSCSSGTSGDSSSNISTISNYSYISDKSDTEKN